MTAAASTVAAELARAYDALHSIDPGGTRDDWVRAGMAAKAAGLGFDDFDAWSARADNYSARAASDAWRSFKAGGIGPGTLFAMARASGWNPQRQQHAHHVPAPRPAPRLEVKHDRPQPHETLSEHGVALFADCVPLPDTAGAAYLRARQCVLPPVDGDLRFHPRLRHPPSGYVGPGLVALVTDAVTREPLTLHRTWIRPDGTKAPEADPPRLLLGGHRKRGGVIRLWSDEAVSAGLAIAEGIETALAIAHAYTPAWASIDAGNLAAFPVLAGIKSLLIAADHDPAGIRAAHTCAERWASGRREVHIVMAPAAGQDINDLARAAA